MPTYLEVLGLLQGTRANAAFQVVADRRTVAFLAFIKTDLDTPVVRKVVGLVVSGDLLAEVLFLLDIEACGGGSAVIVATVSPEFPVDRRDRSGEEGKESENAHGVLEGRKL